MDVLEKEIEDIVWDCIENVDHNLLIDRGLYINSEAFHLRQVELGNYGRADLIGIHIHPKRGGVRSIVVDIYELKKESIDVNTLMQACRYATAVTRIFEKHLLKTSIYNRIFLVGKSINTNGDFVFLLNEMNNCVAYTFSVDLFKGVRFEQKYGYHKTNEVLPDITKYRNRISEQLQYYILPDLSLPTGEIESTEPPF